MGLVGDHKIGRRLSYSLADVHIHNVYIRTDRQIYVQGMHIYSPPIIITTSVMPQASLANRAN